jgi:alkylation response protein AidB-like acyl-CoA dehydrogenase
MTLHARDLHLVQPGGADAVPDSRGVNLWRADPAFARLLGLYLPEGLLAVLMPRLDQLGALAGDALDRLAAIADRNPPTLQPRTRRGEDAERIDYHPAYREMERLAFAEFGLAAMSHRAGVFGWPEPLPPAAKYALTFLFAQAEFGLLCPVNMTDSLARALKRFGSPDLVARYLPLLTSQDLDTLHQGAMFLTEQGAGSDIAATAVTAAPGSDGTYRLSGDKWFCSNADAEVALVLARIEGGPPGLGGVALFLLPRTLPDGTANALRIVRLKEKLGTRSMASGEVHLDGAVAWLIGDPHSGFRQMAEMINSSRLSNSVRSAAMMRRAVHEALFVARHRRVGGRCLIDLPLMQRQIAKMLMRAEQARTMAFQAAEAMRRADAGDAHAARLLRILTPLLKFRACRDARGVVGDAMDVRGGYGYIEEWPEPRLLRDAHLGSIWEGASNVVALDVLRAARKERAFGALSAHVRGLLTEAPLEPCEGALERASTLLRRAQQDEAMARSAASALYNIASAAAMAWEAGKLGDPHRATLARMVLEHRVLPRDPLSEDAGPPAALAELLAAA